MEFPSNSLLVLLKFARTQQFNTDVLKASYEVLKYLYYLAEKKLLPKGETGEQMSPEQVIEAILADHVISHKHRPELNGSGLIEALTIEDAEEIEDALSHEVKAFGPGLWITLGLWVLEVVLKKVIF